MSQVYNENLDGAVAKISDDLAAYGLLFKVANKVQAAGDAVFENLTMRQQSLLYVLSLFGDYAPTLQELAAVFGSSYQNVKRMAATLEEQECLSIEKDAIDRRKLRIILNREHFGSEGLKNMEKTKMFLAHIYEGLSKEEVKAFKHILLTIDKNLDEMPEI